MSLPVIIAKNQTAGAILVADLGVTVPASGQLTLTEGLFVSEITNSPGLHSEVDAGNIIINVGGVDLTIEQSRTYIEPSSPNIEIKNNFTATTNPGVSDDKNAGYSVGSTWVNTVSAIIWVLTNASVGAATWQRGQALVLGNTAPLDLGAAAAGVSSEVSRKDHVHTHGVQAGGTLHASATGSVAGFISAADKTKLDGIATGATATPLTNTAPVAVTKATAVVGVSTEAARADHKHDATTAAAVAATVGQANAEGTGTTLARSTHTHAHAVGTPVGITDTTNAAGSAVTFVRSDHTHAHGNRGGGSLHANATNSVAGFMSAADKAKLDADVFGNNYQYVEDLPESTTTSSSYQTKFSLTTPALTGTYRVQWNATVGTNSTQRAVYVQCWNVTDSDPVSGEFNQEPKDTDDEIAMMGFELVVFTGAAKTFEMQWRSEGGGTTARISNSRIEIFRVF